MFGKKPKKQSKLPQLYRSLGIATSVTVAPSGFRAKLDHRGGQSYSLRSLSDLVTASDENPKRARIMSRNDDDDGPGAPTPEISIPDVGANHDAESGNEPTGECRVLTLIVTTDVHVVLCLLPPEEYVGDVEMDIVSTGGYYVDTIDTVSLTLRWNLLFQSQRGASHPGLLLLPLTL